MDDPMGNVGFVDEGEHRFVRLEFRIVGHEGRVGRFELLGIARSDAELGDRELRAADRSEHAIRIVEVDDVDGADRGEHAISSADPAASGAYVGRT